MRYDVRFPKESTDISHSNQLISEFQSDYIKELSRKKWNPKYVLTREQSREKHQHYHGILFLDGQKVQDISQPIAMAERIWQRKLELPSPSNPPGEDGETNPHNHLIYPCTRARSGETVKNGIMLRNDDPQCEEKRKECFKRASWMQRHDRLSKNPLDKVEKIDLTRFPSRKRRALTISQLNALLQVLPFKLRCIVLVAAYTGLRRGEIAALTWNDVRLDGEEPVFIAPANITKNGKRAVLPLRPELVKALTEYRKTATDDLIFGKFPEFGRLKKYWLEAGIPCEPGSGYDFHSLRATFGTMLGATGAAPRVAQEAMRHSDSRLTEFIYTDRANLNIRAAVNDLPGIDEANRGT